MPLLLISLSASAILGDTVGYWIGYTSGPKIFQSREIAFLPQGPSAQSQGFYEKHGGEAIILARFVPFLRAFAPVVAGVGKMDIGSFCLST